jgi:hypothetical protein
MKSGGENIVDYASRHAHTGPDAQRILLHLRGRDAMRWTLIAAKLILGALLTVLVPAVTLFIFGLYPDSPMRTGFSFWQLALFIAAIYLAVGLFLGWRLDDSVLLDQVRYLANSWGPLTTDQPFTQTSWDVEMQYEGGAVMLWIGVLVFGPRLVLEGAQELHARAKLRPLNKDRLVEVILALLPLDHGIPLAQLRRDDEDGQELAYALAFARLQDWIDVSKDGRHVWLLSDARKVLGSQPGG